MAPKVVKKAKVRATEKPIEKVIEKITTKKKKKRNYTSFSIYLFKLLRNINNNKQYHLGISRHSMLIMNNFVNDMVETIAMEAGRLAAHGKKNTMGSSEIQAAAKLLLPGGLAEHAVIQGINALAKYNKSQAVKRQLSKDASPS